MELLKASIELEDVLDIITKEMGYTVVIALSISGEMLVEDGIKKAIEIAKTAIKEGK